MLKYKVNSPPTPLMYTWNLYGGDRGRINGTEMDALRRSARISKLDRKTN